MESSNEVFILSEKLGILHEHSREALREENYDRFYDLLHNYQQIIRDEIKRCLGTSNDVKIFSQQEDKLYPSTFVYFRKEMLWHTIEFAIFLNLAKDTIVPGKEGDFLYPSEIAVMFIELLEASTLKQCVLSDVMLAEAIQRRETTASSVNQLNHLAEQTTYKWRFVLSTLGDLDKERELTDKQYLLRLPDVLRAYLISQGEHLSIANTKALVSPTLSSLSGAEKQSSESLNMALQASRDIDMQDSALVPYQEDSVYIDYFAESSALPEDCNEEMTVWLILLSSEVLLQQKISMSFDGSSITELVLQQLGSIVRRTEKLSGLFSARNNQLETEIERRLSDVEGHVNTVANAVEKLFFFTENARKWTMQLMTKPETCDSMPVHFEFESSMMVSTTREEVPEERLIVLTPKAGMPGYSQSLSLFRIADQTYEEPPQQKLKNLQEKLRQLFQACQAERVYLKELLYIRFNQKSGLDLCEKTDKEQSTNFQRTKNEFELAIGEWQIWQKDMFGYMAGFEREVFEANDVATDLNSGGLHAGKEFRK